MRSRMRERACMTCALELGARLRARAGPQHANLRGPRLLRTACRCFRAACAPPRRRATAAALLQWMPDRPALNTCRSAGVHTALQVYTCRGPWLPRRAESAFAALVVFADCECALSGAPLACERQVRARSQRRRRSACIDQLLVAQQQQGRWSRGWAARAVRRSDRPLRFGRRCGARARARAGRERLSTGRAGTWIG